MTKLHSRRPVEMRIGHRTISFLDASDDIEIYDSHLEHTPFKKLLGAEESPGWDSSLRRSQVIEYESCPRKFIFSTVFDIRQKYRSRAMDQGSYAHITMSLLQAGYSNQEVLSILTDLMDAVMIYADEPENQERVQDANIGYFTGLFAHEQINDYCVKKGNRIIGTEVLARTKLVAHGTSLNVSCRCDMLVEARDGNLYIPDLKCTSYPPDTYLQTLGPTLQPAFYYLVVQSCLPKELKSKLKGFLYIVVQKPGITRHGTNTVDKVQPLDEFVSSCRDWIAGKKEWAKYKAGREAEPPIRIYEAMLNRIDLDTAKVRMARYLAEARQPLTVLQYPPRESSCGFGNVRCQYLPICNVSPALWETTIKDGSRYKFGARDPLSSDFVDAICTDAWRAVRDTAKKPHWREKQLKPHLPPELSRRKDRLPLTSLHVKTGQVMSAASRRAAVPVQE